MGMKYLNSGIAIHIITVGTQMEVMVHGVTPHYPARGGTIVMSALVITVIQVGYSGHIPLLHLHHCFPLILPLLPFFPTVAPPLFIIHLFL